jgi:hypothetical protein
VKNQLEDLRRRSGHRDASAVIVIDQFEELLAGEGSSSNRQPEMPGEPATSTPAERFLAFLREATKEPDGRLVVLATLRSDFLGTFQCHPSLVGVPFDDLKLGPMEAPAYARVIEGPAEVAGLQLDARLTERMVADTRTGDALPLLAFTLRELWERYGKDGDLTLTEYEHLGGLEGSVQRAADGVIAARPLSAEEEEGLRRAFLQLCRINEEGQHARTTAPWEAMPPASRETLQRFVEARLLISGKDNGTIEVAHEALLRTWPLLKGWLEESREFLLWKSRFQGALGEYVLSGTLLAGKPLEEAERWLNQTAMDSFERRLILVSLSARRRQRLRARALASAVVMAAGSIWWQVKQIRGGQFREYRLSQAGTVDIDPFASMIYGLAAFGRFRMLDLQEARAFEKAISNSNELSKPLHTGHFWLSGLLELNNGEVVTSDMSGHVRRWKNWAPAGKPLFLRAGISSLIRLRSGVVAIGDGAGTIHFLSRGRLLADTIRTGQHLITSLAELRSGELVSGGVDGSLRRWRNGSATGKRLTACKHVGASVAQILELKDQGLITLCSNGSISRWTGFTETSRLDVPQQSHSTTLLLTKDGKLLSGGSKGELNLWQNDFKEVQSINTGQGWITSLISLKTGEIVTGSQDGTIKLWNDMKLSDMSIHARQGQITHLLELQDGGFLSAGDRGKIRSWKKELFMTKSFPATRLSAPSNEVENNIGSLNFATLDNPHALVLVKSACREVRPVLESFFADRSTPYVSPVEREALQVCRDLRNL